MQLIEKYGAKSKYILTDPGISYALNHLMRVLYIKVPVATLPPTTTAKTITNKNGSSSYNKLKTYDKVGRLCSNPQCTNEETKVKKKKIVVVTLLIVTKLLFLPRINHLKNANTAAKLLIVTVNVEKLT